MNTPLLLNSIKEHLIHRYENLLLDSVTLSDTQESSGTLTLKINTNDTLKRDIFLKEYHNNTKVLSAPVYMEILALASIVVSGKLKKDEMAVFAGISNFKNHHAYKEGDTLEGSISKISAKKEFMKYGGSLHVNNTTIAEGKMTAFFNKVDYVGSETEVESVDLTARLEVHTPKKDRHKPSCMIVSDTLIDIKETSYISRYTYPKDHPLIKGHFPGNPIMMGIMQWMSVEDSFSTFISHINKKGHTQWTCNAIIYNQNHIKIAEFKHIKLDSWYHEPSIKNQAEIKETLRINFRNMARPGDTLYSVISDIQQL